MGGDFADGELAWTSYDAVLKEVTKPNKGLKTKHPTQKPTLVFIWCIEQADRHSLNEIILDPYIGSGTTAIACERLKRRWIGIEISEEYCEIAAKRIENETRQLKLF